MQNVIRQPKYILITGGCGFIGMNFIRFLLSYHNNFTGKIINIDKLSYAAQPRPLRAIDDKRYLFIEGNITDAALLEKTLRIHTIDTVIHLAAETHVDNSITQPSTFIESNIQGTFVLLEAIRKSPRNIHLHYVSTDEVFGSLTADEERSFHELSPYHPRNPYSASKAASDSLVWAYHHTYNLSITMSHASNNYGPFQHKEKFIPLLVHNLLHNLPLPIYGDGNNIRDWMHVEDHISALWLILHKAPSGSHYVIGANNSWTNNDLVSYLCHLVSMITNKDLQTLQALITHVEDRAGHDYRYHIDATKITADLGWEPSISFEQGLKVYVKWMIQFYQTASTFK